MVLALEGLSAVGVSLHVGGSLLIVVGQTVVKVAHCIAETSGTSSSWTVPAHPKPQWRRPDGKWRRQHAGSKSYAAAGWALFAVGNLMRFVSMRFAAQTVLGGLGSLQFVVIPFASRWLLGISSQLSTAVGVAVVLLGNVLIIMYGPAEVAFTLHELRGQWATAPMQRLLLLLGGLMAALQLLWWHLNRKGPWAAALQQPQAVAKLRSPRHGPHQGAGASGQQAQFIQGPGAAPLDLEKAPGPAPHTALLEPVVALGGAYLGADPDAVHVFVGALLFSAVASFVGAWSVLFSKSLTYVVTAAPASLRDWYSWFVIGAFLGTAAFWVRQSNRGLKLYPATLIMPLMQAFWMCMSVVEGGIYFEELTRLPPRSLALLLLGLLLALVGALSMGVAGYISERAGGWESDGSGQLASKLSDTPGMEAFGELEARPDTGSAKKRQSVTSAQASFDGLDGWAQAMRHQTHASPPNSRRGSDPATPLLVHGGSGRLAASGGGSPLQQSGSGISLQASGDGQAAAEAASDIVLDWRQRMEGPGGIMQRVRQAFQRGSE